MTTPAPAKRRKKTPVTIPEAKPKNGTKPKVVEAKKAPAEPPYEIPGFPIAEGPAINPRKLTERDESIVVILPAGVFQYVWEMVEVRARDDHKRYKGVPAVSVAAEGAVSAFRAANAAAEQRKVKHGTKKKR